MIGSDWKDQISGSPVKQTGEVRTLSPEDIKPSSSNPRMLFDPKPLQELKLSIETHGVLVPLTVYKLAGSDKYAIIDGERRYKCCSILYKERKLTTVPVNVVHAPKKLAQLIYMFNIHSFREQWELMPTALGLQEVIDELSSSEESVTNDVDRLHQITGLSNPQIRRCLKILSFPQKYQALSLEPNPEKRIPSNFWIEVLPVLEHVRKVFPSLGEEKQNGNIEMLDNLVIKYRAKNIRSVIHFRRITESIEISEDDEHLRSRVDDRLREFILDPEMETRQAFDGFIADSRRLNKALDAIDGFKKQLERAKLENAIEGRFELIDKLTNLKNYIDELVESLQGNDPNSIED